MREDFGWDFFIGSDGDCAFTPDGDIQVVEGPALVAQDVQTAALTSRGSLFYAAGFGQGLIESMRGPGNHQGIIQKLRQAALEDVRVDWESIEAGQHQEGKYYLKFAVLGDLPSNKVLLFDIADILNHG